jgi:glycine cleavage system transcriptional repressor
MAVAPEGDGHSLDSPVPARPALALAFVGLARLPSRSHSPRDQRCGSTVTEFAVTAIGRDRPGIVAAISGALHELGGNIEDSRMAILGGHFAVMLIVEAPDEVDRERLEERLADAKRRVELDALTVNAVASAPRESARPTHIVSVYGADHPGIVHTVTSTLAERGVNITDLQTRVAGAADSAFYVMLIEVALGEARPEQVAASLREAGEAAEVEITLSKLETDPL